MNDQKPLHEIIPACDISIFTHAERVLHHQHQKELFATAKSTTALPDGYKLSWDANPATLEQLRAWVKLEKRCCSFLHLEILEQADSINLEMTGEGMNALLAVSPTVLLPLLTPNANRQGH
jgi:hypothetical protein